MRRDSQERSGERKPLQLGKGGLSESFVTHVRETIEKHGSTKIKVLRSFLDTGTSTKEVASTLAHMIGAKLGEVRGHTFTLHA